MEETYTRLHEDREQTKSLILVWFLLRNERENVELLTHWASIKYEFLKIEQNITANKLSSYESRKKIGLLQMKNIF